MSGRTIAQYLELPAGSCVTMVGAGGKTTIMLSLAEDLASAGRRVLVTTTTKIWPPHPIPLICLADAEDVERALSSAFERSRIVAFGSEIGSEGKLYGVDPALICRLLLGCVADIALCEADGAAGKPAKAHRVGEPVVPECAVVILAVSGVDAVGQLVDERTVHRVDEFCRVTGAARGEPLLPRHLATSLAAMAEHRPAGARTVFVLNKVDGPELEAAARRVVEALKASSPHGLALMTSRGRVVTAARWP